MNKKHHNLAFVPENLQTIFESPDEVSMPELNYNEFGEPINSVNDISPHFSDADAHAFWTDEEGYTILGAPELFHPLNVDRYDDNSYSGRLWNDLKVISFWNYPDKWEFKKIVKQLSQELSNYYNKDINILSDPEWEVEIVPFQTDGSWQYDREFKTELVKAMDYEGIQKYEKSKKELKQEHIKSPILKKKEKFPYGFGSKHPKAGRNLRWQGKLVAESLNF